MPLFLAGTLLACGLVIPVAIAAKVETTVSEEPPTFNDPDSLIVCPAGSVKRTRATTYRELDPVRLAEARKEPPPGYVFASMLTQPEVKYPGGFFSKRRPGYASVSIMIGLDGKPAEPQIVCSIERRFEEAAVEALMRVRFRPATLHGDAVESLALVPVDFSLRARK